MARRGARRRRANGEETATSMTNPAAAAAPSSSGRYGPPSADGRNRNDGHNGLILVGSYLLFGALHELAHLACAAVLGLSGGAPDDGAGSFLFWTLLGRRCRIPSLRSDDAVRGRLGARNRAAAAIVRHSGWVASVALAAGTLALAGRWQKKARRGDGPWLRLASLAACATALEALSTDLLGLGVLPLLVTTNDEDPSFATTLFCGNFGIVLLNSAWVQVDGGRSALSVLEKMINVTMMRGAQSGGVVTFTRGKGEKAKELHGTRARVVNMKRTDLCQLIIAKLKKVAFTPFGKMKGASVSPYLVRTFCGHTRFATTSKAGFDGTHPHRWTPPQRRRVYRFRTTTGGAAPAPAPAKGAHVVGVENYITHNGDLDSYEINGATYDLETVQDWLECATGSPRPSAVDSAAIAGLIDLLRTQGCFGLSARYAACFGLATSGMTSDGDDANLPGYDHFERIGAVFEGVLDEKLLDRTLEEIGSDRAARRDLSQEVLSELRKQFVELIGPLARYVNDEEMGACLARFVEVTIDAFFDNDLMNTTKIFMKNARGSFGLCVNSSLDADSQLCIAARGQPMSVAFFPKKGVMCYASEQAAVKAALAVETPGGDVSAGDEERNGFRLDLDDLGGEVCLIDYGERAKGERVVSPPNRSRRVARYRVMGDSAMIFLLKLSEAVRQESVLLHRTILLEDNEFIKPLRDESNDPVLSDIRDIPKVCQSIQDDWNNKRHGVVSLNRLTALNLASTISKRLQAIVDGTTERHHGDIDILLTGCEVSLWLAEQFASDLKKAFPRLGIMAMSSNKILGLFGQEISIPTIGFPYSSSLSLLNMEDAIVIIVSHSGGTFAPMQCSSLLQSKTRNIFAVTSEWDTVIGKQLRGMFREGDTMFNSRVFTTDVGLRPAEPCSVSVAATHQLLTHIFQHVAIVILGDPNFRRVSEATITENDLNILERCNQENIIALERIVGVDNGGDKLMGGLDKKEKQLRQVGDIWAEHVLENAKAYIMTFIYIIATVTVGYPLITGIATAAGLKAEWALYLTRFFDALIYFWLPQINITILRLLQGRNLRHRMVGRTVVVADCPWVAQAGEAFLSKIFACSYSIAGLNVLSGNPADHLVHRHTHRVCRGTLLICGRPDGRLKALTSAEASVCLSINQASSIQSIGGTCETVTIGHNPYKLPLSYRAIFLDRHRPKFLCEHLLDKVVFYNETMQPKHIHQQDPSSVDAISAISEVSEDTEDEPASGGRGSGRFRGSLKSAASARSLRGTISSGVKKAVGSRANSLGAFDDNESTGKSTGALMGAYSSLQNKASTATASKNKSSQNESDDIGDMSGSSRISRMKASIVGLKSNLRSSLMISSHGSRNSMIGISLRDTLRDALGYARRSDAGDHSRRSTGPGMLKPRVDVDNIIKQLAEKKVETSKLRKLFYEHCDEDGQLSLGEFIKAYSTVDQSLSNDEMVILFHRTDLDHNGMLDLNEFLNLTVMPHMKTQARARTMIRDGSGLINVKASKEEYFGEQLGRRNSLVLHEGLSHSQNVAMELYEARIASFQRFVAMTVMFHQMGRRVQSFFPRISFGLLGYRMDRTHSIMRVATTASPVSGADVREQMETLKLMLKVKKSVRVICHAWAQYKEKKNKVLVQKMD